MVKHLKQVGMQESTREQHTGWVGRSARWHTGLARLQDPSGRQPACTYEGLSAAGNREAQGHRPTVQIASKPSYLRDMPMVWVREAERQRQRRFALEAGLKLCHCRLICPGASNWDSGPAQCLNSDAGGSVIHIAYMYIFCTSRSAREGNRMRLLVLFGFV